ncbi:MAG: type II toxin-antitoxin system Phd/YefM family antitoxin [Euzebya sp.]
MSDVTIRDLRNHGGEVVDRVQRGERLTVTRSGRPVAELVPVQRPALTAAVLLQRWRQLPTVDPVQLQREVDVVIDATL